MTRDLTQKNYQAVRICLQLGLLLNGRATPRYSDKRTIINTLDDLEKFEKENPDAGLRSYDINLTPNKNYPHGLVAIDTEDKKVWVVFQEMATNGEFGSVIMNPTPRGGHIIFQATFLRKSAIKATLNAGMKADYLTNKVTIISVGKYISQMPDAGGRLSKLPYEFTLCKPTNKLQIIDSDKIGEGSRNNTLFVWVNNLQGSHEERLKVSYILGRYFCDPPLPSHEVKQLVKDTPSKPVKKVSMDPNERVAHNIQQDIIFIKELLVGKFIYVVAQKLIYEYVETHWVPVNDLEYESRIEQIILDNPESISVKLKESNTLHIAKGHANRSKVYLQPPDSWFYIAPGKNFKNGYFVFSERMLYEHSNERWVTNISPMDYDPVAKMSFANQDFIVKALGTSRHSINLLRATGYRVLCPQPELQTGGHWSGPPGTGKSTILAFLAYMVGDLAKSCEAADLCNPFSRAEVLSCHLLIINELIYLQAKEEKHIKSFLGRDLIASEVKNRQGYTSQVFNGIIIITSNIGADITFAKSLPMADRFLSLEFDARSGKADPNLLSRLIGNSSGFFNWFLSINEEMLKNLTRASLINKETSFENSFMAQYICEKVSYVDNGILPVMEFKDSYNSFLIEKGLETTRYSTDIVIDFLTVTMSIFNTRIVKRRVTLPGGSRRIVFVGTCLRIPGGSVPKFVNQSYEIDNDIWENYRNNSHDEFIEIPVLNDNVTLPEKQVQELIPIVTKKNEIIYSRDPSSILGKRKTLSQPNPKKTMNIHKGKSELIFTTSKDRFLYPLKQRPEKQKIHKSTLTDVTEVPKYLLKKLPGYSLSYKKETFKESVKLFYKKVYVPLTKLPLNNNFHYNPHTFFSEYNLVRKRIELLMELGDVSSHFLYKMGGSEIIWCQSLHDTQREYPVPDYKKSSTKLFQKKNHFTGKILPENYFWDDKGSPRFTCTPAHTIRDIDKKWRNKIFKEMSRHTNIHLYDCDLSSCHARVIMMFRTRNEAPLLYKSFQENDLYITIAKGIHEKHPVLSAIPIKVLRKIVKIKALAMLNGGGLGTASHMSSFLEALFPGGSDQYKKLLPILVNVLKNLPIVKEFYHHGKFISSKKAVYILTHSDEIRSTNSSHILNSPVLCSLETFIMTYLVEFIGSLDGLYLPLSTQHDGTLLGSMKKLTADDMADLNAGFSDFLQDRIGISLPIEFTDVGQEFLF